MHVCMYVRQARHLISYQKPSKIEEYGFEVDKILQMPLTLTGAYVTKHGD